MTSSISTKQGDEFIFRAFTKDDAAGLTTFFTSLSEQTRSQFGPHPLTAEYVKSHLGQQLAIDKVSRFVLTTQQKIVGYFIVDHNNYPNELKRYASYGIDLDFSVDPVFAPCIHDGYQNQGLTSLAMAALLPILVQAKINSLVLMGGTQAPNLVARNFYKKFNFQAWVNFTPSITI